LAGYLLYRISRGSATIVHFCMDPDFRGNGTARALFEELKRRTAECHGVQLRCRRDFPANQFWPKLDFLPLAERPGKSLTGVPVTTWVYSYDQPTLFSTAEPQEQRVVAALDANVLYDLQDKPDSPQKGIAALSADWLTAEVELCTTDEIYLEIDRSGDGAGRRRRRRFVERMRILRGDRGGERQLQVELRPLFPPEMSRSDESDLRHLAKAIAAKADFFVTRDGGQLRRAGEVLDRYGLSIVRPLDLVVHFDERIRQTEYAPARIAGSLSTVCRVGPTDIDRLSGSFQAFTQREGKTDFQNRLMSCVANPHGIETYTFTGTDGELAALFAFDITNPDRLVVPLLRVRRGPLANAFAQYLPWKAVVRAAADRRRLVEITEPYLPSGSGAMDEIGFTRVDGVWRKHLVQSCCSRGGLVRAIDAVPDGEADPVLSRLRSILSLPASSASPALMAHVERLLWPAKMTGTAVPTFIVPIRPIWAAHLFDEVLAGQDLFGASAHLALSFRNVYYRSANPPHIHAPARVLWYVSGEKGRSGTGSVRAASLIDESVQGRAKELFGRFRRLGAYEWRQVLDAAKGDPYGRLTAFSFTHTELFSSPVPWKEVQGILRSVTGHGNPLAGPVQVSDACFAAIYSLATGNTPQSG
jgi:predicted nucleic acid-binding protein